MIRPVRPDGTIETGGVFVPLPKLPATMHRVELGSNLMLERITSEELSDFIAHAAILIWAPQGAAR